MSSSRNIFQWIFLLHKNYSLSEDNDMNQLILLDAQSIHWELSIGSTIVSRPGYVTERGAAFVPGTPAFISHNISVILCSANVSETRRIKHHYLHSTKSRFLNYFFPFKDGVLSLQVVFMLCLLMFLHEFTPINPKLPLLVAFENVDHTLIQPLYGKMHLRLHWKQVPRISRLGRNNKKLW